MAMHDLAIIPVITPFPESPGIVVPAIVADADERASMRFIEFFTANVRNPNAREAYARAIVDFFGWCERHGLGGLPT